MANDKKELYRWIKIGSILSFIPFVLLGGAFLGYISADYLDKKVISAPLIVYPVSIVQLLRMMVPSSTAFIASFCLETISTP